jgi:hypothetical protein
MDLACWCDASCCTSSGCVEVFVLAFMLAFEGFEELEGRGEQVLEELLAAELKLGGVLSQCEEDERSSFEFSLGSCVGRCSRAMVCEIGVRSS